MAVAVAFAAPAGAAAVVAVGLAAAALFVFVATVVSAAFFFVGIVAFRSVGTAAFVAAVLVSFEIAAGLGAGFTIVFAGGAAVCALAGVGLVGTTFRAVEAFTPPAVDLGAAGLLATTFDVLLPADLPDADLVFSTLGAAGRAAEERALVAAGLLAAARVRDVAVGFVARAAGRLALARLTDAVGCVAERAAALDVVAGLAVRPDGFFVAGDLAVAAFDLGAACLGAACLEAAGLAAVAFASTDLRTTVLAALRSRAAGLVLGDMSATPEIGRSLRSVIDCDAPRGHQGASRSRLRRRRRFREVRPPCRRR